MLSRIYVAGPYTNPDPCVNTKIAVDLGNELVDLGFFPFIPHLTHFWHTMTPRPYEQWLELDNAWIPVCDAVLRFSGASSGADAEVKLAESLGIPVFFELNDLVEASRKGG